jgi:hypothetical protein
MVSLNLRLPDDLHAALKLRAEEEQRSLNNLILVLLRVGIPNTQPKEAHRMESLTLRMLGQSVTFTRSQWEDLRNELRADSTLAARIGRLLEDSESSLSIT